MRIIVIILVFLGLIALESCYCGWNGNGADCQIVCSQFDDYSLRIGDISRSSREWETVEVDTIQDKIHFAYLLVIEEYFLEVEMIVLEDSFILDSLNSYVQERTDFSKCYFNLQSFNVKEFSMSPNECCANESNRCIYEKTPGELRTSIAADVLCGNDTLDFQLQMNFQTVERESCEC